MGQTQRVSTNNTRVFSLYTAYGPGWACTLHDTTIVVMGTGGGKTTIRLNSGGWRTATTKTRMNQFANQYCNGAFSVCQRKGEWYVMLKNQHYQPDNGEPYWLAKKEIPFEDGMEFEI